ncbi:hypothetical protein SLS62_006637 [Diatrype stigma]|uniref:Uncharacterized protein n=1 Tax=Diatrype stigma TaxID=117547 RepID=A0AAN9UQJ9_9PEZI
MPRILPWKKLGQDPTVVSTPSTPSTPARPKVTDVASGKRQLHSSDDISPFTFKKARTSTLSSNHHLHRHHPNHWKKGPEADDRYRMVEDELLSIAQRFTAHLHAVEYQRLKEASKSQNAKTIRDISRPVIGPMSDLVKRKQERKTRAEKQRLAMKKASGNNDETESESDDYRSTSLYGLMESPKRKATRLDAVVATSALTRAAAGFDGSSYHKNIEFERLPGMRPKKDVILPQVDDETTDGDDNDDDADDDLDAAGPSTIPKLNEKLLQPNRQSSQTPTGHRTANQGAIKRVAPDASGEIKVDDSSSDDTHGDFFTRLKNRRASLKVNRERSRHGSNNTKPMSSNQDVIPGFL